MLVTHFKAMADADGYTRRTQAAAALKFFDWAYANGDKSALDLEYVALPDSVKTLVRKSWGEVKDGSGKPVSFK